MSAIELPATTRRSLRFKRFSWNRAGDGTFPPITATAAAAASGRSGSAGDADTDEIENANAGPARAAVKPSRSTGAGVDNPGAAESDAAPSSDARRRDKAAPNAAAAGADAAAQLKPASNQHGKKRKNLYLGPSWDDQAGTLPTSGGSDEMDFDSLLSQMQSQQQSAAAPTPSKRKKGHGGGDSDPQRPASAG